MGGYGYATLRLPVRVRVRIRLLGLRQRILEGTRRYSAGIRQGTGLFAVGFLANSFSSMFDVDSGRFEHSLEFWNPREILVRIHGSTLHDRNR